MSPLLQDLRYALRALRKARGLSAVAVVTLSVAIAALTTVFSIVNTGYFRPLPYPDADRLVALSARLPGRYSPWNSAPLDVVNAIRHNAKSFERVAAYNGWTGFLLADKQGSVQLMATHVDTALLGIVGARAQRGRLFSAEEITTGAPVALISDSLWRTRYANDESIVNQLVRLDGQPHTIIGVLAPGFRFNNTSDVWVPLAERADSLPPKKAEWYWLIAKRKPDVPLAQARREMDQLAHNLAASDPADYKQFSLVVQKSIVSRSNPAYLTMAAIFVLLTLCVFLIACTNVGNLLLVRAAERRGEMALRASLGASRARLLRRSLAESVVLAAASGALGALLSWAMTRVLLATFPTQGFPSWLRFGLDWRVLAFVVGTTVLAVLAFGLVPARESARVNLLDALKAGGDSVVANTEVMRRSRRSVVVQVALSLALFVAATLFAQSYFFLARFDRGYDAEGVLKAHLALDRNRYAEAASEELAIEALRARLATDPRIERMALAGYFDKLRSSGTDAKGAKAGTPTGFGLYLPGNTEHSADRDLRPSGGRKVVTDEYFQLMKIPIVRGRGFGDADVPGGPGAAIVSERIAKTFWPGADPIGQTFTFGPAGPSFTVVGVARDVRDPTSSLAAGSSTAAWPHVYFSARQATSRPELYIRPRAPVAAVQSAVESALRGVEPEAILWPIKTLASDSEAQFLTRIFGGAVGGFALVGAFLAMLGVYGVIAYGVAQRRREIGLRVALGASPSQVVTLFTRQGARFIAIGLAIGMVLALGLSALVRSLVWGVSAFDPVSYVAAAIVFGGVALVACWLPARKAARVEPMEALRTL